MQSFVKLIFLALVFGSLVGCGSDDNDGGGVDCSKPENGNNSVCEKNCTSNPNDPRCQSDCTINPNDPRCPIVQNIALSIPSYYALESDVFPDLTGHIFGPFWDSASVETHTIKYSSLNNTNAVAYEEEVTEEFPKILQIISRNKSSTYHKVAYYKGNLIGDASVAITDNNGNYSVTQAIDIILPIPVFVADIDEGVFTGGGIFPELEGYPITEVSSKINYGYFGSPNFQTYKAKLQAAGFKPETANKTDDNVWKLEKDGFIYTFEHDNPLLDATKISKWSDLEVPLIGGTVAGFVNHWITNWTNINKYAIWKISVK
ncbi:MAG: hypothetical protein LBT96_03000 [Campylobacteraceae bacterium]|nr:hypothetical protein [Campylobacteraceae bacterium]